MSSPKEKEALITAAVHKGVEPSRDEVQEATSVLAWDDQFFHDEDDIIAVFDFDYALMEDFNKKVEWAAMLFPPWLVLSTIFSCHPCFLGRRVQWEVYSQHVAVTRDGIRFVRDKRPTFCGCPCTDAGRESKTVPFDKITDCDILEPAGNTCICIPNVLATVRVDTASSGVSQEGIVKHELTLVGLKDPYAFKKLVWAMKRSNGQAYHSTAARSSVLSQLEGREASGGPVNVFDANVPELLREIRDELREQTKLLKATQEKSSDTKETSKEETSLADLL